MPVVDSPGAWTVRAEAYGALLERSSAGVLFTDPSGAILSANPAACRMLGRDEAELRRVGRVGLIDTGDDRWIDAIAVRNAEGFFHGELRARRADGSTFPVELSSAIVGTGRAIVLVRDVSHYVDAVERAGEAQRAAETVMDILESISDAYVAVDRHWALTYLNRRAEHLLRLDGSQVIGRDLWEVFPSVRETIFEERYRTLMRTGAPVEFEGYYEGTGLRFEVRAFPLSGQGMGVYFRDISDRHAAQAERERLLVSERAARATAEAAQRELTVQATHDEVTGLLNRWGLLREVADIQTRRPGSPLALLFIDLDQFKLVNDTLGHVVGDEVLAAVGRRLNDLLPEGGLLARFGGDEFVVVVPDCSAECGEGLARRVVTTGTDHITTRSTQLSITASVGIARAAHGGDIDTLLRNADAALHRAKDAGRDGYAWFDQALHNRTARRLDIQHHLRRALENQDELGLHFQPAFDLRTWHVAHVEALARWRHPAWGGVPPLDFIPVAEESGLILSVGEHIIAAATRQAARWAHVPGVRVWVNVSPRQLALPGLARLLEHHLSAAGVPAERFGIEVTESTADDGRLVANLRAVRDLGVAVAIDDFGTGFSSLSRLARTPVDVVKIDRSFVAASGTRTGDTLLAGIVSLAHALGAQVIAEGIETPAQLDAVTTAGANAATGFLLARPRSASTMAWRSEHTQP